MSFLSPSWTWAWPSWLTELLSGVACVVLGILVAGVAWLIDPADLPRGVVAVVAVVVAQLAAFGYEGIWDANGFSWSDIRQREIGILLGSLVAAAAWRRFT